MTQNLYSVLTRFYATSSHEFLNFNNVQIVFISERTYKIQLVAPEKEKKKKNLYISKMLLSELTRAIPERLNTTMLLLSLNTSPEYRNL